MYLRQGDPKTVKNVENALSFVSSGVLNLNNIKFDSKPVFGGLVFKHNNHGIEIRYNNYHDTFTHYGKGDDLRFKNQLMQFLTAIKGEASKKGIEDGVDGVIINNVKDYGMYTTYNTPHTVYEAIDNSQVKSIYNNSEFANPDDMYAS
jgi:hypothetical protein